MTAAEQVVVLKRSKLRPRAAGYPFTASVGNKARREGVDSPTRPTWSEAMVLYGKCCTHDMPCLYSDRFWASGEMHAAKRWSLGGFQNVLDSADGGPALQSAGLLVFAPGQLRGSFFDRERQGLDVGVCGKRDWSEFGMRKRSGELSSLVGRNFFGSDVCVLPTKRRVTW